MKVLIFGSRYYDDYTRVKKELYYFLKDHAITEVVSGACDRGTLTFTRPDKTKVYGADGLGEMWAAEHGIPVISIPADWVNYAKAAGPIRNTKIQSILNPDDKAAGFWDGTSTGTKDMAKKAKDRVGENNILIVYYKNYY